VTLDVTLSVTLVTMNVTLVTMNVTLVIMNVTRGQKQAFDVWNVRCHVSSSFVAFRHVEKSRFVTQITTS